MHYYAIVHHDPGSAYGVSFPDVPDCFAAADNTKDIMANAIAALDDYFADGHGVPDPRDIDIIRAELAEDLAEGAFLISVPLIERDTLVMRANISMRRGAIKSIDEYAKMLDMNRSQFLEMAARNEMARAGR